MKHFVDANVFLRYMTNDIPEQAEAVAALLRKAADGELKLITNAMVIAELVWVMESVYRLPRETIQEHMEIVLNTPGLHIPEAEMVSQAVLWYAEKNVDFIDAYNAAWMDEMGLSRIVTFDQKHFRRFSQLKALLPPG